MMTSASFRLLRTGLIGSLILGFAAGGHMAGGGLLPEPAILAALCALTILPVAVLTRFRLSAPVLAGVLGAGQVWLHWAFDALSSEAPVATMPLSGHTGHVSVPVPGAANMAMPAHAADGGWQMVAAHAVATVCTALVLARGEQALWALAAWLRPLVQLPAPAIIQPARAPRPCAPLLVLPRNVRGLRLPSRRGPPTLVPAA